MKTDKLQNIHFILLRASNEISNTFRHLYSSLSLLTMDKTDEVKASFLQKSGLVTNAEAGIGKQNTFVDHF